MLTEVVFILMAYLLGAVPFGYLFTKWFTGKNILELGSKSIGSTNVGRIAGKKIATFTQICDMLKGLLPVSAILLLQKNNITSFADYFIYLIALASIMGHNFFYFPEIQRRKRGKYHPGGFHITGPLTGIGISTHFFHCKMANQLCLLRLYLFRNIITAYRTVVPRIFLLLLLFTHSFSADHNNALSQHRKID